MLELFHTQKYYLGGGAVSYTHLDVYKRQDLFAPVLIKIREIVGEENYNER